MSVKITIIYDKPSGKKDLRGGFGFSCLIDISGKKVLFDTGSRADILLHNLKKLKIKPREIKTVFITHKHWDHMGGLFGFLEKNNNCNVVLPGSFSKEFQNEVRSMGAKVKIARKKSLIFNGLFSSGTFEGDIPEQAAVMFSKNGLVIIAGCAHPGIAYMVRKIAVGFKKPVHAVVGGFHLCESSYTEIISVARSFKRVRVQKIAACHCTGKKAHKIFRKQFEKRNIRTVLGTELTM